MVCTGTFAATAAEAASIGSAPEVFAPSESRMTRAGGGCLAAFSSRLFTAPREALIASPMAVPCTPVIPSASRSMPSCRAPRSVLGGTSTAALPAKATRPTLNSSGSPSTKVRAASLAAVNRSGSTSVASIDVETSTATITVARSRGTRTSAVGRAKPTTSSASMARKSPAGTCRRQAGRCGATRSSSRRLVKRTAYRLRRRCISR